MNYPAYRISLKTLATSTLYFLIAYLPFISVAQSIFPLAGWLKDILCIIICACALASGKIRLNTNLACALIYSVIVMFSLIAGNSLSIGDKLDAFRYRCEYAITLSLLFSSFRYSNAEIVTIGKRILNILYITGVIVAFIGCIELINPSFVHSIYGGSLTTHLTVWTGGVAKSARLISTLGNPINLGFQMTLTIGAVLFLFHAQNNKTLYKKILYLVSLIVFAVVTVYTYSRSAYFMVIGVVVTFYLSQILFSRRNIKKKIFLLLSILIVIVALLIAINQIESLAYRIGGMTFEGFMKNTRFIRALEAFDEDWNNMLEAIFGCGIGKRIGASGQYVFEFGYASLLFESGLIGLLLFALMICRSVTNEIKSMKNRENIIKPNTIYLCYIAAFVCGMFVEDLYFQSPFNLYIWISFSILGAKISRREEYSKQVVN